MTWSAGERISSTLLVLHKPVSSALDGEHADALPMRR